MLSQQLHAAAAAHRLEQRGHGFHVHRIGLVAGQAQQHGLVAAVALAGGTQRAVELALHARGAFEQAFVLQAQREDARRAHRPHGVRTARPDADLEEVED